MAVSQAMQSVGGRYLLQHRLGAGGMGVVYSAIDRLAQQPVALKRVLAVPSPLSGKMPQDGFSLYVALTHEFQTLASLRHPHIISVLDYGFDQDQPYFTMDLLTTPETIFDAARDQPISEKVRLLVQVLQALAYLHRRGILHRDLKPGNVLVTKGEIKVLDFGLAAAREQATTLEGTPAYIAPEVLSGSPATEASDLYAVGVIAYELLTGRHPFNTDDIQMLLKDVLVSQPDMTLLENAVTGSTKVSVGTPATLPLGTSDLMASPDSETEVDSHSSEVPLTLRIGDLSPVLSIDGETRPDDHAEDDNGQRTLLLSAVDETVVTPGATSRPASTRLGVIIERLLRKDPARRYIDANVVIRELSLAIGEPLPVETVATRESFLQAAQFIGREAEIAQLLSALDQTSSNVGATWLVGGESGVGKSRLLEELRTIALVKGVLVVRGQASDNGLSYQVWREPLRRLILNIDINDADANVLKTVVPDIDHLVGRSIQTLPELDAEQMQKRLASVITSLIYRQKQPLLIVLEDLHWARSESLALLRQLIQVVEHCPVLIVGSYRDDENSHLAEMLPDGHSLRLKRLGKADVVKLAEAMLGEAGRRAQVYDFLQRETEGNAFFLVEVVRALAENAGNLNNVGDGTLPAHIFTGGVQRIVERRLNRVAPSNYPLLRIAAIYGRQLNLAFLRATSPLVDIDPWLLDCAEAAVLEIQDEQWRFTHDKIRESVLSAIPTEARPSLYRRVAEAIETIYPDPRDYAANLAHFWQIAGDANKECNYAMIAAQHAFRTSAYEEAVTHFRRALALTGEADSPAEQHQRTRLLTDLARVYMRLNDYSEANALLDQSLSLAIKTNSLELQAEAIWSSGYIAHFVGDYVKAAQLLEQSYALFRSVGNAHGTADTLRGLARINMDQGAYAEALTRLKESLSLSRQINDDWRVANALIDLGSADGVQGAFADAMNHLEAGLALFKKLGDRDGTSQTLLNLGQVALFMGQFSHAAEYLAESLAISREIGDQRLAADALNNLGYNALSQKDFVGAKPYFEDCATIYRRAGFQWGTANTLINLGHVEGGLGHSDEAKKDYHEGLVLAEGLGAVPLILEIVAGMARIEAHSGQPAKAVELAGVALYHPASGPDIKGIIEPLLHELEQILTSQEIELILEESKRSELSKVCAELFQL